MLCFAVIQQLRIRTFGGQLTCVKSDVFFLSLQKCERLLLHLFCSDLSSNYQEPVSPSVSLEASLSTEEKFTGLMSHRVTVIVILMACNMQYLSVKRDKL